MNLYPNPARFVGKTREGMILRAFNTFQDRNVVGGGGSRSIETRVVLGRVSLLENSHETDEVFNIAEVKQA